MPRQWCPAQAALLSSVAHKGGNADWQKVKTMSKTHFEDISGFSSTCLQEVSEMFDISLPRLRLQKEIHMNISVPEHGAAEESWTVSRALSQPLSK